MTDTTGWYNPIADTGLDPSGCPKSLQGPPSTRLGDALGHTVRAVARFADYHLPLALIRVYQVIPASARGKLFGGPSMSHATARSIRSRGGEGWQILALGVSNHPDRPPMP